jgi:hypothetical protein
MSEEGGLDYEGAILAGYSERDLQPPDPRETKVNEHMDHCGACSNGIDCAKLQTLIEELTNHAQT